MIDFPIGDLMDEDACRDWLVRYLHPDALACPRCGAEERRVAQQNGFWTGWRCRLCDRYYTALSGTVFAKTRQRPSTLVLLVRGVAQGVSTARLARELGLGRVRVHELRQQLQQNLRATRPTAPLPDDVLEADELYQNAGEKRHAAPGPGRPAAPPRQSTAGTRDLRHRPATRLLGGRAREPGGAL